MAVVERPVAVVRAEPRLAGRQVRRLLSDGVIHGVLIAGLVLVFFPIAWAVSTSLKNPGDIFLYPPTWIPNPIRWQNYVQAMTIVPFHLFFRNTIFVTGSAMVAETLSSAIVAYSMSRTSVATS